MQSAVNSYNNAIVNDLNKSNAKIFDGLVTNHRPNTVPESIFKSYFLPGFIGKNPNPNWMLEWVSIAGSPSSEVSVIDSQGEELFRVPPVLDTHAVLLNRDSTGLDAIFTHAKRLDTTLSGSGQFVMGELDKKATEVVSSLPDSKETRWMDIYKRYGVELPESSKPPTSITNDTEDLFEY